MKIKNTITKSLLAVSLLLLYTCDKDETQTVTTFNNLVLEDNFDTDGFIDPNIWSFETGDGSAQGIPGWGNNELQVYTDRPENVTVENGYLLITAKKENFQGGAYTSARLTTRGKFEQAYGRFEARIRLPYGKGYWPAFWLLGVPQNESEIWPAIGEIDIMEYVGDAPTRVFGTIHGPNYSGGQSISKNYELQNSRFDTKFHVFGVEWSPNQINFYVDGDLYQTLTPKDVEEKTGGKGKWVFNDREFYIILNMAIGGNLPGSPNSETEFPQTMLVDYVRVYTK